VKNEFSRKKKKKYENGKSLELSILIFSTFTPVLLELH
jgi:hypothetical protein